MISDLKKFQEKQNYNHDLNRKITLMEEQAMKLISDGNFTEFNLLIEKIDLLQKKYVNYSED